MEPPKTYNLSGLRSFSGALGLTIDDFNSILDVSLPARRFPSITLNRGAVIEIFRFVEKQMSPLHTILCALIEDFCNIKAQSLYTTVKKLNADLPKKKKDKDNLDAWLEFPFTITSKDADKSKGKGVGKRDLDNPEPMPSGKVPKITPGREDALLESQANELIALRELLTSLRKEMNTKDALLQSQAKNLNDLREQVESLRKGKNNQHRNMNKVLKRRNETVEDLTKEKEENKKAQQELDAQVATITAELEELDVKAEALKKQKRNLQKRVSKLKNKPLKEDTEKDSLITQLKQTVKDYAADIAYLEDLTDIMESNEIVTFENGKYVNELRELIMILLTKGGVSMSKMNVVIREVVKKLSGQDLGKLPSKAVLCRLLVEAKTIAAVQVTEAMLEDADPEDPSGHVLHSDAASKFHRHYEGFQLTTPTGKTLTLAISETAGGSTEELTEAFTDAVKQLAAAVINKEDDIVAKLITSVKHTMSDQGSVNPCFNAALKELRSSLLDKVIPGWYTLSPETQEKIKEMTNFFCKMHIVVNFATEADKVLKLFETNIAEGRNPFVKFMGESGSARLVRTACKALTSRGCERSGIHELWEAYLREREKENALVTFKGNRFNILFYDGGAVYYHKDDIQDFLSSISDPNNLLQSVAFDIQEPAYLAGVRALGIINKVITGPYWRLLEKDGGILTLNDHLHQMKISMESWSKDASELLTKEGFLFSEDVVPITKDHIYEKLLAPTTPLIENLTQLALEVMMTSLQIILERQAKDNLPGGKYWHPTELQQSSTNHVPKTNTISERDFAMLDHIIRNKPAAGVHVIEVIIMFTNNKTTEWLGEMDVSKKDDLLDHARKYYPEMKRVLKEREARLREKKLQKLKARQAKKESAEVKEHLNRVGLTNKLSALGGLWQSSEVDERLQLIPKETAKKEALYVQLHFLRSVLCAKGRKELYQKQHLGDHYDSVQMTTNLKTVLELNPSDAAPAIDTGLTYRPADELTERISLMKRSLAHRLDDERMKRRAKATKEKLQIFLDNPLGLVGRFILHHCLDPHKQAQWYDGKVLEIDEDNNDPLKTEYLVQYGGKEADLDSGDDQTQDTDENIWRFNLLDDMRKDCQHTSTKSTNKTSKMNSKMNTRLLILTDSQGRGVEPSEHLEVRFRPGGKAHDAGALVDQGDITRYEDVAIWLGGNNAHPRSGRVFNEAKLKADLHRAVAYVREANPRARIALVSATRRIPDAESENLHVVNWIIKSVAGEANIICANVYRLLENAFYCPEDYLTDGVHLTNEAKWAVINSIRHSLRVELVPIAAPPPPPAPIAVAGRNDILSMFFGARLLYGHLWFCTAEHAYQHQKCKDAGLHQQANAILTASLPSDAKKLGREANTRVSQDDRLVILESVLSERWRQQADFQLALSSTGTKRIVHTVKDRFWGHLNGAGQNAYGKALMKLRYFSR